MKAFIKASLLLLIVLDSVGLGHLQSVQWSEKRGLELTVCPQGPPQCDFAKIQEAIDAASEGATIRIGAGTYVENLAIRKSVRLVGAGQDKVFLQWPPATEPVIPALEIKTVERPIQVWIEEMSSIKPGPPHIDKGIAGIYIEGWTQVVLRRLAISGYVVGTWILVAQRKEFPLLLLKPQVIIDEVRISHNSFGISTTMSYPIHIWRTIITENETGISSGEFLLEESTITKNRVGIHVSLPPHRLEEGAAVIRNNRISENGVGVWLMAGYGSGFRPPEPKPGEVPPLVTIQENQIVANREYGISFQTARCVEIDERW